MAWRMIAYLIEDQLDSTQPSTIAGSTEKRSGQFPARAEMLPPIRDVIVMLLGKREDE